MLGDLDLNSSIANSRRKLESLYTQSLALLSALKNRLITLKTLAIYFGSNTS